MASHTSLRTHYVPVILPQRRSHPLLKALERTRCGRMFLTTPEHSVLEFMGEEKGPVAHLYLHSWGVLDEILAHGEIGLADTYIQRQWDTSDLATLFTFVLANAKAFEGFFYGKPLYALGLTLKNLFRRNSVQGSRRNIMAHYDLGNDFYALWLDESMTYSAGLFHGNAQMSLAAAQEAKYQRILDRLEAKPGQHVLDIGCGWGGFALAAAREGLTVTGITLSERQADFARRRIAEAGLADRISLHIQDYRTLEGRFDHIVSIGMFEHVGEEYWGEYFSTLREHLKPDGKVMMQVITLKEKLFARLRHRIGFIEEYIFPGGFLPSRPRFLAAAADGGFICNDLFAFGGDYAITLRHWLSRMEVQKRAVMALGYDEAFLRLWRFYLSLCIGAFMTRRTDIMQVELALKPQA